MKITTARPEDLAEILPFLDTAYGFAPGFFGERLASQWNSEGVDWSGVFIIRGENGALASLVRFWEMDLVQAGRPVVCGGIGSVSTASDARGQGAMSALMHHALQEMKRRAYPLAILWGDRFRYAPFGFESAGRALQFEVTSKGLRRCGIDPLESEEFGDDVLARIEAVRARMPFHRRRHKSEISRLYRTSTRQVFAATKNEELQSAIGDFGFLVLDEGRVVEWGGDAETVLRLAAFTAQQNIADTWSFSLPDGVAAPPLLQKTMTNWSINSGWCRAAILDLPATLHAFQMENSLDVFARYTPSEQVWRLFGRPDAPRNLWMSPIDTI
ncbi:Acetyltransferase (GNAT) domain-containing protein [Abditibacterium utsteinense]|uniref:Acetyltransferase (GNAT) domain-containing protein n=1 Tax=Abditibacterium utsteinense TaxID=1960156 RepID=A0A2S8STS5_9BACT|nr:GNAT family N-acetyltransferase [Abditibacterium utsteinense]PQV64205.1 Acetyltransferase (GNAT) domain-containing protein [Abditibacterium utsteinense]